MKLKIGAKLIGGFSVVIVLMLSIFGIGYLGMTNSVKAVDEINVNQNEDFYWASWKSEIIQAGFDYEAYFTTRNDFWLQDAQFRITKANEQQAALEKVISDSRKSEFNSVAAMITVVLGQYQERAKQISNGDYSTIQTAITVEDIGQKMDALLNTVNSTIEKSKAATTTIIAQTAQKQKGFTLLIITIAVIATLMAASIGIFMSRSLSEGINKVKKGLQSMASGDLTVKVDIKDQDEVGDMARSFNELQIHMSSLIAQFKQSAIQLNSAANQLATAAQQSSESTQQVATSARQMAKGAQQHYNNAQKTTKSVNQLSDTISQMAKGTKERSNGVQKVISEVSQVSETMSTVARNAAQAAKGAKQAAESAVTGSEKSALNITGMDKIKSLSTEVAKKIEELGSRSAEIGKIVAVIDDIASQTNLLALNAAIEAARAGEQGRGFAVVSDDVRKLAERSATATKEIAELIASIQKGVKEATQVTIAGSSAVSEGYNMAMEAGKSLKQIMKAASEVNSQVEMISNEVQQVNSATNELFKVIDSVGSIIEENSMATQQMTAKAAQVSKSVETVAGIAAENSTATEQVSVSAQEVRAQVQEIVAASQTLKEIAAILQKWVGMFKVSSGAEKDTRINTTKI
jgi:methyl-accepting chemotaxis protein